MHLMLEYSTDMTFDDIYAFAGARKFTHGQTLQVQGEFDRNELLMQQALFRIDQTRPTLLRLYIRRRYITIDILPYTILEHVVQLLLRLTFSIETGKGHQKPFEAEVTCETVLPLGTTEKYAVENYIRRIVNAVLKLFWIVFDSFKDIKPEKSTLPESIHDRILKWAMWIQNYANRVEEENMDNLIHLMMDAGIFMGHDSDEYVTRQAIIAIGAEYESAAIGPNYPNVAVIIEKVRVGKWKVERTLVIAEETDINMAKLLDMELNITWQV